MEWQEFLSDKTMPKDYFVTINHDGDLAFVKGLGGEGYKILTHESEMGEILSRFHYVYDGQDVPKHMLCGANAAAEKGH